jgi:RNA polymerase sigma-70 factor (ECF subfamily)
MRNDAELLLAARTDASAFRELYERYAERVYGYHLRRTHDPHAAHDLTAETFAQAWRSVKRFRDEADGSGAPWLFGIARNLLRQYHKHNRIETQARERLGLPLAFAESEEYERVDDRIAASSLGPALHTAVSGLPSEQRAALELRVVQQLSYDEVSAKLGCSQNAARLRVSRALRTLTMELGGNEA